MVISFFIFSKMAQEKFETMIFFHVFLKILKKFHQGTKIHKKKALVY